MTPNAQLSRTKLAQVEGAVETLLQVQVFECLSCLNFGGEGEGL